jgi:hypothetical protein
MKGPDVLVPYSADIQETFIVHDVAGIGFRSELAT